MKKSIAKIITIMAMVAAFWGLSATTVWGADEIITITISSFTGLPSGNATYATYDWSEGGVSGKATIYANTSSTSMQFNASNYLFYSTSAIPGTIKSIKLTTASGTNRTYVVYGSSTAYTGTGTSYGTQIGSQTVTTSGTTYTVSSGDYSFFTIVKSGSGAGYLSSVEVTYTPSSGPSAVATTTTVDDSNISNTDVYVGTEAGFLSGIVKDADYNDIAGASVTWSGNNDNVATIDESTGAVTLVGKGSVTFTASYAGQADVYQPSSATYEMEVTSTAPYVQPTNIEITPNYTFWGKNAQFSGSTYDNLSGSKDNVILAWIRGTGSTYANQNAMRFYKDNVLTFTAPEGYEIKSIELEIEDTYSDLVFSPSGWDADNKTWTGSSEEVTMSRPSNGSSYATISTISIILGTPSSVTAPTFSPASGTTFGNEGLDVTICAGTGTTIYYTLDGSNPTTSSSAYSAPIHITETKTVKAIAADGGDVSNIASATYTYVAPIIVANNVNIGYDATSGEIPYSISNATNATLTGATCSQEWISNIQIASDKVTFATTTNNGNADRSASFTLSYTGAEDKTVTVTQGHLVVDYATLPFVWEGGVQSDLTALTGVTASGLGSDYAAGNAPYRIKFDTDGDYIQVKTDSQPGKVTIGVKMLGGGSTSTITVKSSANGNTFTDIEALTISGSQNDVLELNTSNSFASTDRYVKLVFTKGSNVGVGPITITKYVAPSTDPVISANDVEIGWNVTAGSIAFTISNPVEGCILTASKSASWLTLGAVGNESVSFTCPANLGNERSAKVTLTYSNNTNVTVTKEVKITQGANEDIPVVDAGDSYTLFSGSLEEGDYIVYYNGSAMKNTVESGRLSYKTVTPSNDVITNDDASIVWHIAQSDSYWTFQLKSK